MIEIRSQRWLSDCPLLGTDGAIMVLELAHQPYLKGRGSRWEGWDYELATADGRA